MTDVLVNGVATLGTTALVVAVYLLVLRLFTVSGHLPILHPLLSGGLLLAVIVFVVYPDYASFRHFSAPFYWLLGPATVALALPLHHELRRLRAMLTPLMLAIAGGAVIAPLVAIALVAALGSGDILLSVATKSVSTPIALGVAETIGAIAPLAAGLVIFTGVVGVIVAEPLLRLLGIRDERILGIALGVNAHGAGTARAFEISPRCGAFASLAMGLTGLLTALALPLLIHLFGH